MSKYSKAIKRQAILLHEQGWGYRSIAQKLSISKSTIKRWVFLGKHGISLDKKMTHNPFSARCKAHGIETRWENKLSFSETAILVNLDNPSLIAAWQKRYLEEGIDGLEPKSKGRPPMKPKKTVKIQQNESSLSDKERIRELEAENARLKYEISFYDDFIKEMREIAKSNRASKKKPKHSQ